MKTEEAMADVVARDVVQRDPEPLPSRSEALVFGTRLLLGLEGSSSASMSAISRSRVSRLWSCLSLIWPGSADSMRSMSTSSSRRSWPNRRSSSDLVRARALSSRESGSACAPAWTASEETCSVVKSTKHSRTLGAVPDKRPAGSARRYLPVRDATLISGIAGPGRSRPARQVDRTSLSNPIR
jgi:hypothetical protein